LLLMVKLYFVYKLSEIFISNLLKKNCSKVVLKYILLILNNVF